MTDNKDYSRTDRLVRLKLTLLDRLAAYNALGASEAGQELADEIKRLRETIKQEEES